MLECTERTSEASSAARGTSVSSMYFGSREHWASRQLFYSKTSNGAMRDDASHTFATAETIGSARRSVYCA